MDQRETRRLRAELGEKFIEKPSEELPEKPHNEPQAPKRLQAPDEPQAPIELQAEPFTLLPAEQATKPAPQFFMEPTPLTPLTSAPPLPLFSESPTPNVACVAIKHHTRHRVIERIGLRSPLASCSAFVRLGLYPAATPPFSSWTLDMVACAGQWEPSDHG